MNERPDELDRQFEEAWSDSTTFRPEESKDLCRYWWLKGRIAGLDSGMKALTQIKCPGCDVALTTQNAGGYRTFCDRCVKAMPPLPTDGAGYLIKEGSRCPNFEWERVADTNNGQ
jgi:hypothetical protein